MDLNSNNFTKRYAGYDEDKTEFVFGYIHGSARTMMKESEKGRENIGYSSEGAQKMNAELLKMTEFLGSIPDVDFAKLQLELATQQKILSGVQHLITTESNRREKTRGK